MQRKKHDSNLMGERFNRLLVIEKDTSKKDKSWICKCDCGNIISVLQSNLLRKNTQSCGCLQKERASKASFRDLSGMRFGSLIAISAICDKDNHNRIKWLCKCDCGNETEVFACNLARGHTKSCGRCNTVGDLTGQVFGRLTVLRKDKNKKYHYICKCSCGNSEEISVLQRSLLKGDTKSCGCLFRETTSRNNLKDITGQTFGFLKVIERDKTKPPRKVYWICECSCENKTIVSIAGSNLKSGHTRSCGCITESEIATKLKQYCKKQYKSISEYRILKNPNTDRWLPFDIFIPSYNFFIEVQGEQHYCYNNYFHKQSQSLEYLQYKDKIKKEYAENNGYYLAIDLRKIKNIEEAIENIESFIQNIILKGSENHGK